jgi:hypothetical protein
MLRALCLSCVLVLLAAAEKTAPSAVKVIGDSNSCAKRPRRAYSITTQQPVRDPAHCRTKISTSDSSPLAARAGPPSARSIWQRAAHQSSPLLTLENMQAGAASNKSAAITGKAAAEPDSLAGDLELPVVLPEHPTDEKDAYLCTSVQLPDRPLKLVGIASTSDQRIVHHMLLFGEHGSCRRGFACLRLSPLIKTCEAVQPRWMVKSCCRPAVRLGAG